MLIKYALVPSLIFLFPALLLADGPKTYKVAEFIEMMDKERARIELRVKEAKGVFSKEVKIREEETRKLNNRWSGKRIRISGEVEEITRQDGVRRGNLRSPYISFGCEGRPGKLVCQFTNKNLPDLKKFEFLVRDQEVIIEGKFQSIHQIEHGEWWGIYGITDCKFIKLKLYQRPIGHE